MYSVKNQIRVRYAETDRMGYVYYGNYAQYFEVARVEMLRGLGISYKTLEDSGIMLPVLDFTIKYIKPAFYDDLLTIKTKNWFRL
jgi:acyl-CoA thioester hydrolase